MATQDVPGANPANADKLAHGNWAEHADGSLILVEGNESGRVVFQMFDLTHRPYTRWLGAMTEAEFKLKFSFKPIGTSTERWTWHDKTSFPWDRVMSVFQAPKPEFVNPEDELSAAQRVAESLKLHGQRLTEDIVAGRAEQKARRGHAIWDRIDSAVREFLSS